MGAFYDYLVSKRYKYWKNPNVPNRPSEVSPRRGDKISLYAILYIDIFIDPGPPVQHATWVVNLYDFVKEGRATTIAQYFNRGDRSLTKSNPYYDPSFEERLGGTKERLGG